MITEPRSIVMIKSHSLGVGDLLRSSAAWRVLNNKWPQAQLHLVFLSKHPGYPTEGLIEQHPLLTSAHFITVRDKDPSHADGQKVALRTVWASLRQIVKTVNADMVIDFEPYGIKTSLLTWLAGQASGASTWGINQFWGRSVFYKHTAPSVKDFANRHSLSLPMDYTNRDFVVLSALGLKRGTTPIEMQVTQEGREWQTKHQQPLRTGLPVIGLNIGCGTPDAMVKRPDLNHLAQCFHQLLSQQPATILLSGAPFEKDVNQTFTALLNKLSPDTRIVDAAGETTLSSSTGLIDACDVFVSTDSGPYHMAVALRKPTLVWFTYAEVTSFHNQAWCRRLIQPTVESFVAEAQSLLALGRNR
jgi:ADP-heptose:LPS heptosyltransferase